MINEYPNKSIEILDSTLRDGLYALNFNIDKTLAENIAKN